MKIATLTLNPCIDKTLYFNQAFKTDALNRAAYAMINAGGKGINVARIYRRLGVRASAYGFSGGAMGALLKTLLAKEDILTALRSGVNNYVVKPFTPDTLQEKVFK